MQHTVPNTTLNTVYLDHNATSPLREKVKSCMIETMDLGGNPSSVHAMGRAARRVVEDAREKIRTVVKAPKSAQVIFTGSGTEANTLALKGVDVDRILVSACEHASVMALCDAAAHIPVDGNGRIDLGHLQSLLAQSGPRTIVSVMMANNETGALQNIEDIVHLGHRFGAIVHTDAVQALGKIDVDFVALGVDMMSLSAHKIGGPLGVGALIAATDVALTPFNRGGGQESGLRGGTENVPGLAGFSVALEQAPNQVLRMAKIKALRDGMEARILHMAPDAFVFSASVPRLPNTSFLTMPGVDFETQVMAFDLAGVCVSSGSACGSGKAKSSSVLKAMGIADDLAKSAIRVSLGPDTTPDDIESFLSVWKDLYERKQQNLNVA